MAAHFYVYVIFRLNGVPCYIGKGQRGRWQQHVTRSHNKRLQRIFAKASGSLPVVKIREGLTNDEACKTEVAFIAALGRADLRKGPLVNLTDGGEGAPGQLQSAATRAKKSAILKGRGRPPQVIAAMLASHGSPRWRASQRMSHLGKVLPPDVCLKLSAAQLKKVGLTIEGFQAKLELLRAIPRADLTIVRAAEELGVSCLTAKRWCAKSGIETQTDVERLAAFAARSAGNQYGLGNKRTPEGQAKVSAAVTAANRHRVVTPEYRELRRLIALRYHAERRARKGLAS